MTHDTILEAIAPGTDYYATLGLTERLNLDAQELETAFHALSRRYHPDRYAAADIRTRRISLENTALVNKAYRTLREPWERARYAVERFEGHAGDIQPKPPGNLFEEILELQEILADLREAVASGQASDAMKAHAQHVAAPFRAAWESLDARRQDLFDRWDASGSADRARLAEEMKALLSERRYLARVVADIDAAMEGKIAPRDI